jgi:hypothetical protein
MKLSNETRDVLKNFAAINSNIVFNGGNEIKTMSEAKNILVSATVDETFPDNQLGIYDLNEFLGVLSMFDDPELAFSQDFNSVKIVQDNRSVNYYFSDPSILTTPSKAITMPDPEVTVTLTVDDIAQMRKAASALGVSDVVITANPGDSKITVRVTDVEDATANNFELSVDGPAATAPYRFIFNIANFKIMQGDYNVQISSKLISQWTHSSSELTYFIALEKSSTYGG